MTEFSLERRVHTDAETVWRAWTTTEGLASWWWPQLPDTTYEIDARVGGAYRFESRAAGIGVRGEFTTVQRPELLELTWYWLGGDDVVQPDEVRVEFRPDGDATVITVRHRVNQPGDSGAGLCQGWGDVLDRLTVTPLP